MSHLSFPLRQQVFDKVDFLLGERDEANNRVQEY